jgi:uracil-DNA glycosylase
MTKKQQLEILKQKVLADPNLPFRDEAHNLVFGYGSENPKILFIGEAPGRNEDLSGIPFNGAAGKVLDELLTTININRDEIYITSVLQYRPPKNRDPKPKEIALFQPYLDEQIKILSPKIIATLGRFSLHKFLPNAKIAEIHGKPQKLDWQGMHLTLIPLYHPAAVIYRRNLKETLEFDFQIIKDYL